MLQAMTCGKSTMLHCNRAYTALIIEETTCDCCTCLLFIVTAVKLNIFLQKAIHGKTLQRNLNLLLYWNRRNRKKAQKSQSET